VLGIWAEEYDALPPDMSNEIVLESPLGTLHGSHRCSLLYALIHAETADVLATYGRDFYAGRPALTRNRFGDGTAWYVASDPEQDFVDGLMAHICAEHGIEAAMAPTPGVEVTQRKNGDATLTFVLNHNEEPAKVQLGDVAGRDLLSGSDVSGEVELAGRGVMIIRAQG
jgi:beta-galactosidase